MRGGWGVDYNLCPDVGVKKSETDPCLGMTNILKTYPYDMDGITWQTYPILRDFNLMNVNEPKEN